ncbi:MAG: hypothetical protein V1492_05165 [Candidatus Micrarchaeota archaeon]
MNVSIGFRGMFVLLLLFAAVFASLSVSGYSTSQTSYRQGGQGYITLTINNPSSASGEGMTAVSATVMASPELEMTGSQSIGDIPPLASTVVTIPFRVKSNAQNGFYSVTVKISGYSQTSQSGSQSFYSQSISVPVTVVNLAVFSATADQTILTGVDDVKFTIVNNGGIAKNSVLTINVANGTQAAGVALYGRNQVYIGDITNNVTIETTLDSRAATDGPGTVPLLITYYDEVGNQQSTTLNVRMTVKKEQLDLTFMQDSPILTRKEGALTLRVKNNGNDPISDLKIYFTDPAIRLKDTDKLDFGTIAAGGEATVTTTVFAAYTPGLNNIPVRITWVEKNVQKEGTSFIPLTISSDADVAVYIETKPAPLTVGQEHTLSVLVSNLGSYSIDNVDVEIESDSLRSMDISSKQYIGKLDTNDFSTVQFKTKVVAPSAGDYEMKIRIHYRDQSGEWKEKTLTQPLKVYDAPQADGTMTFVLIGGIVVLAIAAWYFFIRKKKA